MHQPVAAAQPLSHALVFSGNRRVFCRIVLRGALLELISVGFYRFWLATDIRRHLWSNTSVGGDPAEYTGRARELLVGFLIALAIIVPFYLIYFILGLEAERYQAFASIPLFLFLFMFGQFALYRSARYRVTRTVWRGLRFSMNGSGWAYSWRATLWILAVVATLGIAYPWREASLERYRMRHISYGTLEGAFDGRPTELLKRIWWVWPLAPLAVALMVPFPFLYAAFKAVSWRWWVSGVRLGEVSFSSSLPRTALFALHWKMVGWSLLVFAVLSALYFGLIYAVVFGGQEPVDQAEIATALQAPEILAGLAGIYLLAGVTMGALVRLYLLRDVWAKIAGTTTAINLEAADDVSGQGDLATSLGEGLIDGLSVGGF